MSAPNYSISQFPSRNPHARSPLMLTMIVVPNTSPEQIVANVMANTALPHRWLKFHEANSQPAIMVGGGPSAADCIEEIRQLQADGGVVFAMNGSSRWLRGHGIMPDWQLIADAKEETASLVDPQAPCHLFSSVVNPKTMNAVEHPLVWHPVIDGIAECFPEDRKGQEYALVGGTSAGTHAMCAAYVLGHRTFHCFGYDSSHRGTASHAYAQAMNDAIPNVEVTWAGKTYLASVAMKAQSEHFQTTGRLMQKMGCSITVHGDGLLPAMWNTPPENLCERDKYRLMWQTEIYRQCSPGEMAVPAILQHLQPEGLILDFGCGTGRASVELAKLGHEVLLIDFADNCRDHEALTLAFLEHDLTEPLEIRTECGICCDVMEHIPPDDVIRVLENIMASARKVFFTIGTLPDDWGTVIGQSLHLTVRPYQWWGSILSRVGRIVYEQHVTGQSTFVVERNPAVIRH